MEVGTTDSSLVHVSFSFERDILFVVDLNLLSIVVNWRVLDRRILPQNPAKKTRPL